MSTGITSRVAVLMPAYNAGQVINRAIASLRRSTYPADLYVVDDGSTEPISDIVVPFPRLEVIRLATNGGIANARNAGLGAILAGGYDYIANLDADDICRPDRIARQVEFLDRHPDVAAVGTWSRVFSEETGETLRIGRDPEAPADVKAAMRFNSAVNNSSTMIRASVFREVGLYSTRYAAAEDYELYRRINRRYPIGNIPTVLMDISISPRGTSLSRRRRQLFDRLAIQVKYFEPFEVGAWLGVAKTLALFLFPVRLLSWLKSVHGHPVRDGDDDHSENGLSVGAPEQRPGIATRH
jgi:glycosyltransferase involved in cell wall biosynthesis